MDIFHCEDFHHVPGSAAFGDQELFPVPFRTVDRRDARAGRTQPKWVWGAKKIGLCGGLGSARHCSIT